MGAFLFFVTYLLIFFIATRILRARAGIGNRYNLKITGPGGYGSWVFRAGLASLFWPATFVVWLARGRPEPRVVFNEKARQRNQPGPR